MPSHPKRPFLTVGLPFIAFMVLGHRALTYIGQGRYDVSSYKFSEFTTISKLSSLPNANKIATATFAEIQWKVKDEYARQKELLVTQNRVSIPKEALVIPPPPPSEDYDMVPVAPSGEKSE